MEGRGVKAIDGDGIPVYYCPYFPIGSIYINVTNINPSIYFGGVWEQIKDTFLLGSGDVYEAGTTGGEAAHTLTTDEMPKHNHAIPNQNSAGYNGSYPVMGSKGWVSTPPSQYTGNVGGNAPHNNMPPYLAVYIWQRIA